MIAHYYLIFLCFVFYWCLLEAAEIEKNVYLSQKYIDEINSENLPWKAGQNFHPKIPIENVWKLVGKHTRKHPEHSIQKYTQNDIDDESFLPESFDCRDQWPECISIGDVYDQGNCQSGWAIATASTFTDRLCIMTEGRFTERLSAGHLLTCCHLCGRGCNGGWDDAAWHFFQKHGLATGGAYGSDEGCHPYPLGPCDHTIVNNTVPGCSESLVKTPRCRIKCSNSNYEIPFKQDLHKVRNINFLNPGGVDSAKFDMIMAGPIEAFMEIYSDFFNYKSGVYQLSAKAKFVGYHQVKVIGWGIENNTIPYWLAVNSWGKNWGDNGLFKIRLLRNGIGFENKWISGIPDGQSQNKYFPKKYIY